ncbi:MULTISPECIES: rhamnan synthesis F family protein [Methylobacterium]|uniref:rhamnan synthesis F family protein n=1 Tax=Methylobacterium TaxID=407 RepID=UPI0013EC08CC|nr:rhamnan synthesis F family protein [Methylobacterium sp. DB0501]NGM34197.1 hypothetical protein [Methylobacterium sp. DB0501]
MKIAVVVHCYYLDLSIEIINLLSNLQKDFDIFITIGDVSIAEDLKKKLDEISMPNTCNIIIGQNKGRNFGQFLVELREELRKYDLLCHVHTKKSLDRGDFLRGWGEYLIKNTIGNSDIWEKTIRLFDENKKCGLAYPKKYTPLPFWSEHWLGNHGIAQSWAGQYNIKIANGPIRYPVGGMFWVRPIAIDQLLKHPWGYDMFPQEEMQLDGTMQHAIERLVSVVTLENGYSQYEYATDLDLYRPIENKNYMSDPNISVENIAKNISNSKFISFDIFSLCASGRQNIEYLALQNVLRDLTKNGDNISKNDYVSLRRLLELQSRFDRRHAGNADLQEIVDIISVQLNLKEKNILNRESKYIIDIFNEDPRFKEIYKIASNHRKIILVAECAYDKILMENIIKKINLPEPDYYFTTSETAGLCADGSIWTSIKEKVNASDWDILHFGKEIYVDYFIPIKNKVKAIHIY